MTSPRIWRRGDGPASTWSVPNLITIARILLAPVFLWLLFVAGHDDVGLRIVVAVLFVFAIATDGVDGYLARSRNLVTDLGKILDPFADKVLIGGALIGLSVLGELPWWVTILVLVREIGITVYRQVALRGHTVVAASWLGKVKTVLQSVAVTSALLPMPQLLGSWYDWVNIVLMTAAVVMTLVSGIDYVAAALRSKRRTPRA